MKQPKTETEILAAAHSIMEEMRTASALIDGGESRAWAAAHQALHKAIERAGLGNAIDAAKNKLLYSE